MKRAIERLIASPFILVLFLLLLPVMVFVGVFWVMGWAIRVWTGR